MLGFACFLFGTAAGVITLSLSFMCLRFLGQGSMMLGATNLVARWFDIRRGLAMSVLMLGFAASISLHPLLSKWLIETVGWREAWVWLGFMIWVLMLPLLWLLVFDKPKPLKLLPDGMVVDGTNGDAQPSDEQAASMFSASALSMAISMPAVGGCRIAATPNTSSRYRWFCWPYHWLILPSLSILEPPFSTPLYLALIPPPT